MPTHARNDKRFPIRLLWGVTPQQREKAREIGCNWAVVYTCGHRRNDFPIYYSADPKIAAVRRRHNSAEVEQEQRLLKESVEHAHQLGLKAMLHSYEVSIPEEFREVYPRLYEPEVKEYRQLAPEVRKNRGPCPANPRLREIISHKVAETVAKVPGIDAYAFCLNECLSGTAVRHRCEKCREIPFAQMIKWVADAVREGVHSVDASIRFFHRMWGINEHDDMYFENFRRRAEFRGDHGPRWLHAFAKVFAPDHMHYKPSCDLSEYLRMQKNTDMGFIAKGTWADVSIDHPLNPWIKRITNHDAIIELSWESTNLSHSNFHVLANQFQRMARYARQCGATGLGGMPAAWGFKHTHHGTAGHEGADRPWIGELDDDHHRLGMLNFDAFAAVCNDPDADIRQAMQHGLEKRYRQKLPAALADYILETQTIKARTVNVRGIRCTGGDLVNMHYQLLRYGPTIPNWEQRISRDPANLKRIWSENERNIARAAAILDELRQYEGRIPDKAFADFIHCFGLLHDTATSHGRRQNLAFLLWALKDGTVTPDLQTIERIERYAG